MQQAPTVARGERAMTTTTELARSLALVAADLDDRGYRFAGVVRQAARTLIAAPVPTTEDGCRGCGRALDQPVTGGRRLWCSERCRRRHRR